MYRFSSAHLSLPRVTSEQCIFPTKPRRDLLAQNGRPISSAEHGRNIFCGICGRLNTKINIVGVISIYPSDKSRRVRLLFCTMEFSNSNIRSKGVERFVALFLFHIKVSVAVCFALAFPQFFNLYKGLQKIARHHSCARSRFLAGEGGARDVVLGVIPKLFVCH